MPPFDLTPHILITTLVTESIIVNNLIINTYYYGKRDKNKL